ncbi:GGDEF domain-containing protein [Parendozoicomonas sp. Alg238-R29]|uniref:GGDEF domain-containing protein n=1 Tax=Parendozoicomonas sp. Alg238-R29 TaxID=2993446 RepID=UPI00248EA912|nr:GGDEF domain-containing protein [Parendozoicomonas sp. Alg238-R29]
MAYQQMNKSRKEAYLRSIRDPLTGCFTRYYMDEAVTRLIDLNSRRSDRSRLCLVMFDVDYFKEINDTWGHITGDKALIHMTEILQGSIRTSDILVRYGGDEFLLCMPFCDVNHAYQKLSETCRKISTTLLTVDDRELAVNDRDLAVNDREYTMPVSVGLIEHPKGGSFRDSLKYVDTALYHAKSNGRNQIFIGSTP